MDGVEDTINATVASLAGTPGIDGMLLVGSTATGTRRPQSDIDIVVLVSDSADWPRSFRDGGREVHFDRAGRQIEVSFTTLGRARLRLHAEAAEGKPWRAEALVHSRELGVRGAATDALLADARALLAAGPPMLGEGERKWLCFEAWNHRKDAEDRLDDPATANLLATAAFDSMARLLFWMEKRWQPHPKGLLPAIAELDSEFHSLAEGFLTAGAAPERLQALHLMENHLELRFGLEFEAPYTSPPEQRPALELDARATLTP